MAALTGLEKAGGNMQLVFADIGEYLLISHRERFDREEAPDGSPWEQLAESTLRRKMLKGVRREKGKNRKSLTKKRGIGTKAGAINALARSRILVERGDLQDTLRYQASADDLQFGTDRIYGATQQFGDEERSIPSREFLGLSEADQEEIMAIIDRHLEMAMAA